MYSGIAIEGPKYGQTIESTKDTVHVYGPVPGKPDWKRLVGSYVFTRGAWHWSSLNPSGEQ